MASRWVSMLHRLRPQSLGLYSVAALSICMYEVAFSTVWLCRYLLSQPWFSEIALVHIVVFLFVTMPILAAGADTILYEPRTPVLAPVGNLILRWLAPIMEYRWFFICACILGSTASLLAPLGASKTNFLHYFTESGYSCLLSCGLLLLAHALYVVVVNAVLCVSRARTNLLVVSFAGHSAPSSTYSVLPNVFCQGHAPALSAVTAPASAIDITSHSAQGDATLPNAVPTMDTPTTLDGVVISQNSPDVLPACGPRLGRSVERLVTSQTAASSHDVDKEISQHKAAGPAPAAGIEASTTGGLSDAANDKLEDEDVATTRILNKVVLTSSGYEEASASHIDIAVDNGCRPECFERNRDHGGILDVDYTSEISVLAQGLNDGRVVPYTQRPVCRAGSASCAQDIQRCSGSMDNHRTDHLKDIESSSVDTPKNFLTLVPEAFRGNRDIMLNAIVQDPSFFLHAKNSVRKSRRYTLVAIQHQPKILLYAAEEFRLHFRFNIEAICENVLAAQFVPDCFKQSQAFWLTALRAHPGVFDHIPADMQRDCRCVTEPAVKLKVTAAQAVRDRLRKKLSLKSGRGADHASGLEGLSATADYVEDGEEFSAICVVCLDGTSTWVFNGCGHQCLCKKCARKYNEHKAQHGQGALKTSAKNCPLCRQPSRLVHVDKLGRGYDQLVFAG